jgi:hypothetical protein
VRLLVVGARGVKTDQRDAQQLSKASGDTINPLRDRKDSTTVGRE